MSRSFLNELRAASSKKTCFVKIGYEKLELSVRGKVSLTLYESCFNIDGINAATLVGPLDFLIRELASFILRLRIGSSKMNDRDLRNSSNVTL